MTSQKQTDGRRQQQEIYKKRKEKKKRKKREKRKTPLTLLTPATKQRRSFQTASHPHPAEKVIKTVSKTTFLMTFKQHI